MLEKLESWQIMFFLYVISSVLNIWQLKLEDNNESPGLQKLLILLMIVTGFLSLPVTIISLGINHCIVSRLNQKHDAEITSLRAAHIKENHTLSQEDHKRAYNEGYHAGFEDAREVFDENFHKAYSEGYDDGYADCQEALQRSMNFPVELE